MKTVRNLIPALFILAALSAPGAAAAAPELTFTVTSVFDSVDAQPGNGVCADSNGACTLRAAIMEANSTIAADTILLPAAIFLVNRIGASEDLAATGDLDVYNTLTISGAGAATTVIDATGLADRVFDIQAGATVHLSGITVRDAIAGQFARGGGINNAGTCEFSNGIIAANFAESGAGIYNDGVFVLANSEVSNNHANERGGGIENWGAITITNSAISDNRAKFSGGISNSGTLSMDKSTVSGNHAVLDIGGVANSATMNIADSTISNNIADRNGGGLYTYDGVLTLSASTIHTNTAKVDGGGLMVTSTLAPLALLINSTISNNAAYNAGGGIRIDNGTLAIYSSTIAGNVANADNTGGGTGGGISRSGGSANLKNTIVAYNIHPSGGFAIPDECSGAYGTFSYSFIADTTGCTFTNSNTLVNQSPFLVDLADNGGPTLTQALQSKSPAIDAGDPAGCKDHTSTTIARDQRGFLRPLDGNRDGTIRCDIGAFEMPDRRIFLTGIFR